MNRLVRSLKSGVSPRSLSSADSPPVPPARQDPKPLRGLGDAISAATSALGIRPCGGCGRRAEWLNQAVPFKKPGS